MISVPPEIDCSCTGLIASITQSNWRSNSTEPVEQTARSREKLPASAGRIPRSCKARR